MKSLKRTLPILLILLLVGSLLAPRALAAEAYTVSLSSQQGNAEGGDTVSISLAVAGTSAKTFHALYVKLSYDSRYFTYQGAESAVAGFSVEDGGGTLSIARVGGAADVGKLATLRFTAKNTAGSGSFTLASAKVSTAAQAEHDATDAAVSAPLSITVSRNAADAEVWDGVCVDVSWYDPGRDSFTLTTPAQLAGLAAIVNGIYNAGSKIIGNTAYIVDTKVEGQDSGGSNKSTDTYHCGADDFHGKTVYLGADLDMGGSGCNYMPVGGQYLMTKNDPNTKISTSFCGVFDGRGHTVKNIYCDRHCSTGNFGDGQSVGLIGRLGVHDSDPESLRPSGAAVRNVAVTGYIYANRSVGGIVGKIGKTIGGATIENCANFATVMNTDAKGCGGIVGSGWNSGVVRNCYNAGTVSSTYPCPTGGISGSNEITLENCYNVGKISASRDSFAMAIGTNNGGAPYDTCVLNCWYLAGSAPGGGYYSGSTAYNAGALTADAMRGEDFLNQLGGAFAKDTKNQNQGYPVLSWQNPGGQTGSGDSMGGSQTDGVSSEQTGIIILPDVKVTAGRAEAAVESAAVDEAVEAIQSGAGNMVTVRVETTETVSAASVSVKSADVDKLAALTEAALTVETAVGSVALSHEALTAISEQAGSGDVSITVEKKSDAEVQALVAENENLRAADAQDAVVIQVSISSGSKHITSFGGARLKLTLPVDESYTTGETYKVIVLSDDGSVETIYGKVVEKNGKKFAALELGHLTTFIVTKIPAISFNDVKLGAWYYDAVVSAVTKGLFTGVGDDQFAPASPMTRAMLVTVLYRMAGSPAVTDGSSFTDVEAGTWYADAVAWAEATGVTSGYEDGRFGAEDNVTRQQMATMLRRYAALVGLDVSAAANLSAYTDQSDIASWAKAAMQWANALGLITGRTETTLAPNGTATRAEVATILVRYLSVNG